MFWNMVYLFYFIIQNIKSNCYLSFLNFFPIIFFWCKIYSFPVLFIYKRFTFYYSLRVFLAFFRIQRGCYSALRTFVLFFIDGIYYYFFVFLSNIIEIWSTTIRIYFMTFIIQQINLIEDKITIFHRFQIILISIFKWIKKLFYNFICFIINHYF